MSNMGASSSGTSRVFAPSKAVVAKGISGPFE
jgi:hypothetical protein